MVADGVQQIEAGRDEHAENGKGSQILRMLADIGNLRRNPVDHFFNRGIHRFDRENAEKQHDGNHDFAKRRADRDQQDQGDPCEQEFLPESGFLQQALKATPRIAGSGKKNVGYLFPWLPLISKTRPSSPCPRSPDCNLAALRIQSRHRQGKPTTESAPEFVTAL